MADSRLDQCRILSPEDERQPLLNRSNLRPTTYGEAGPSEDVRHLPFSRADYSTFVIPGIAMLWPWNMFLAGASFLSLCLAASPHLQRVFPSAMIATSTVSNLSVMLLLALVEFTASYISRIMLALSIFIAVFIQLGVSPNILPENPPTYFAFLIVMIMISGGATALKQNGALVFAAVSGRAEYMQALMVGQGIAGLLPPLVQVTMALMLPSHSSQATRGTAGYQMSMIIYSVSTIAVSTFAFLAFIPLAQRHVTPRDSPTAEHTPKRAIGKAASLPCLTVKISWFAGSIMLVSAETMFFPVFTSKIVSVQPSTAGRLFQPNAFIPLAFFVWNLGDVSGRTVILWSLIPGTNPKTTFVLTGLRAIWILLYGTCNINGGGAKVPSDIYYLLVVQGIFGFSNGWLSTSIMTFALQHVDEDERETTSGLIGLCLVIGLTTGSVLTFATS